MKAPIYYDSETCGLHGMAVLIQYAIGDGPIILHEVWTRPIRETLELIEMFMNHPDGLVGFNMSFDHFHLCKLYTVLSLFEDHEAWPVDNIKELAELEPLGRDGKCLKPVTALDLMMYARKTEYQSLMERKPIYIRKVPTVLAYQLARELDNRIKIKDIYFSRAKKLGAEKWQVKDHIDKRTQQIDPNFKDVALVFKASSALKVLAADALNLPPDEVLLFSDVEVDHVFRPNEVGYAPFAKALYIGNNPNGTWPAKIEYHIDHWQYNALAREYAEKDVWLTRELYHYFGDPPDGDDNSILACAVAAMRWKGFTVDIEKMKRLRDQAKLDMERAPKAPGQVKKWLDPVLSPEERAVLKGCTKKNVLQKLSEFTDVDEDGHEVPTEAAKRAKKVIKARLAKNEWDIYDKIIQAGRMHASYKVSGALSDRMSGDDQMNAMGIKSTEEVRSCFTLAHPGMNLGLGDFDSFEVSIAVAIYKDAKLEADLQTMAVCSECKGEGRITLKKTKEIVTCPECGGCGESLQKIHALFAMAIFPGNSYADIIATKATDNDLYKKGKSGVFSQLYGGTAYTLVERLGVDEDAAEAGAENWRRTYPGIAKAQFDILNRFKSMRQSREGGKIEWHEPATYVESLLGHKRYYHLENQIAKALFDLGEEPPPSWLKMKDKIVRRSEKGAQLVGNAVRSGLFGAAFAVQNANVRSATNHVIQSTGGGITKRLQRRIWDIQPHGVNEWLVMPMNTHDEVGCPAHPSVVDRVAQTVKDVVEEFKPLIPMIKMEWKTGLKTWADK